MSLEVQMLHIFIPITIASRLIPLFCLLCFSHSGKPCFLQPAYLLVTSMSWPYHLSIWALGGANVQEINFWVLDARGLEAASGPWGGLVGGGGVGKDPAPGWTTILLSVSRERGCQPHHTTAPVEAEQGRAEAKKGATEANWGEAAGQGLEAGMGGLWRGGPRWWQELAVPILCQEQVRQVYLGLPSCMEFKYVRYFATDWWWVNKSIASTQVHTHRCQNHLHYHLSTSSSVKLFHIQNQRKNCNDCTMCLLRGFAGTRKLKSCNIKVFNRRFLLPQLFSLLLIIYPPK